MIYILGKLNNIKGIEQQLVVHFYNHYISPYIKALKKVLGMTCTRHSNKVVSQFLFEKLVNISRLIVVFVGDLYVAY
jgi:hypothetical protein